MNKNHFKGHLNEKLPKLNDANKSVFENPQMLMPRISCILQQCQGLFCDLWFPLKVAPTWIENNFKGHLIKKLPKLNNAKKSVFENRQFLKPWTLSVLQLCQGLVCNLWLWRFLVIYSHLVLMLQMGTSICKWQKRSSLILLFISWFQSKINSDQMIFGSSIFLMVYSRRIKTKKSL